jgi:hypothetical protein
MSSSFTGQESGVIRLIVWLLSVCLYMATGYGSLSRDRADVSSESSIAMECVST